MTINFSYFYGNLAIPQIGTEKSVQNEVQRFIEQYEPEYLELIFGYAFKKLYDAGIVANTSIYLDIQNGKEYTNLATIVLKWKGLVRTTPVASPIANYIYFKYMQYHASYSTGSGGKVINVPSTAHVGDTDKMALAWSEMVEANWQLRDFLLSNRDTYPDYKDTFYYSELYKKINVLGI